MTILPHPLGKSNNDNNQQRLADIRGKIIAAESRMAELDAALVASLQEVSNDPEAIHDPNNTADQNHMTADDIQQELASIKVIKEELEKQIGSWRTGSNPKES